MKPNVIVILTDDQGVWASGCYGNDEIRTPNIDRLARSGTRFDNFFCVSPVCSPARASILTGAIPSAHGIHDWIWEPDSEREEIEFLAEQKGYTDFLAENGYICGLSGKWHTGCSSRAQKSFTHWYAHQSGSSPYYESPMYRDGELVVEKDYITDLITDDALDFMDKNANGDKPFYLSVHYTAPHSPWTDNHPEEIVRLYDDCPFETCPQEPRHPWAISFTDLCLGDREQLKGYFAAVTAMDMNVGRILDKLDSLGIRKDTLVFFTSDNGFSCGQHGFWGKGNGTFPLNMYDNSVKVPAIISHPGHLPENNSCESLLSHYDFMPTLLEYLDICNPDADKLPGKSFLPALRGNCSGEHENIVIFDEYGPVRMIRSRDWKYIHRYPYGPDELYNLKNDPDERENLIEDKERTEVLEDMKGMLAEWFFKYADPAFDGTKEPVTGAGQYGLSGLASKGKSAFGVLDKN